MAIAATLLLLYVIITKEIQTSKKSINPAIICGILFASDVAVWNIAIQESKRYSGFTAY
jgi:hypothetical protein